MAAQLDARLVMARIAAMKQLRSMLPSDAAVRGVVAAIAEPSYAAENHSSSSSSALEVDGLQRQHALRHLAVRPLHALLERVERDPSLRLDVVAREGQEQRATRRPPQAPRRSRRRPRPPRRRARQDDLDRTTSALRRAGEVSCAPASGPRRPPIGPVWYDRKRLGADRGFVAPGTGFVSPRLRPPPPPIGPVHCDDEVSCPQASCPEASWSRGFAETGRIQPEGTQAACGSSS